ncbi:MAG: hypothetical protein ABEL97_05620 [Salinibacter sp.]
MEFGHPPNGFYTPTTGQPCPYRDVGDYQHSWGADLLIKYAADMRPGDETATADPFPFDTEHVVVDDVPARNHRIGITRLDDRLTVQVDGEPVNEQPLGTPVTPSLQCTPSLS